MAALVARSDLPEELAVTQQQSVALDPLPQSAHTTIHRLRVSTAKAALAARRTLQHGHHDGRYAVSHYDDVTKWRHFP